MVLLFGVSLAEMTAVIVAAGSFARSGKFVHRGLATIYH